MVRTRAGNRDLLERLFQAGVVVLIETEAGEVSIALPGTEASDLEPIAGLPQEPAKRLPTFCKCWRTGAKNEYPRAPAGKSSRSSAPGKRSDCRLPVSEVCVTSSFQAEDMVVVHMVREVFGNVPVIFLDTGYHFAETYEYRDRLTREWGSEPGECAARAHRGGAGVAVRHSQPDGA